MTGHAAASSSTPAGAGAWRALRTTPLRDILRGRLTGRLDVTSEIAAAELPAPLAEHVLAVVRRTRLWRLEKADVAVELIAHFADGVEAGATAEALIESFGDVKRAAKLIRRAKKRSRPWPWRAAVRSVQGVAALIVLYVMWGVVVWTGTATPSVDYRPMVNASANAVPEAERAWPIYRAAFLKIEDMPKFEAYSRTPLPGEDGWEQVAAYLDGQAEALALARQAAAREGVGFVVGYGIAPEDRALWPEIDQGAVDNGFGDDALLNVLLPHLAEFRGLAKVLALDARRAAAEGDGSRVVEDVAALLAVARHSREVPTIISDLVGISIVNLAVEVVGDVLATTPDVLDDGQLRDLAHHLADRDAVYHVRIGGERWMFQDTIQRLYTDDGNGDGRMTLRGLRLMSEIGGGMSWGVVDDEPAVLVAAALPALSLYMLSRRELVEEWDGLISAYEAEFAVPLWEMDESAPERQLAQWMESPAQAVRRMPVAMLLPALGKLRINSQIARTRHDAVLVAIALTLYQREHGGWPETLEALTPSLLPSMPVDRYDGTPLRYVVHDGRPIVYSVGVDRNDDGGVPPTSTTGHPLWDRAWMWIAPSWLAEARAANPGAADGELTIVLSDGNDMPLADGDWILWPRHVEPLQRFGPPGDAGE